MNLQGRRVRVASLVGALAVAAVVLVQCGPGAGQGGSQEGAPIKIEPSTVWITVQNQTTAPLRDVKVHVVPYGETTLYTATHYGLDAGEKRDFAIGLFRARDNTPLDLRVARVKSVRVEATDVSGKPVQVEVPWR